MPRPIVPAPLPGFVRRRPALVSLLLGAAAACGFAPWSLWPLTLLCLAAWLAIVHAAPGARQAAWRGWAFGVGHFTINNNWFQHAFDFQDKMPPALGYAAPLALALYLAVYPALAAWAAWWMRGRGRDAVADVPYVLAFAAAWIVSEWLRATLLTGYAWDPLAVIWVPVAPVAWSARDIGTYALSGLTIVGAGALLAAMRRRWTLPAVALAVIAAQLARAMLAPPAPPPADPTRRIRVVQPNVGQGQRGADDADLMLGLLGGLSGRAGPAPRLVVWPEGVVRDSVESGYPAWVYGGRDPGMIRRRMTATLGPRDLLLAGGQAFVFDGDRDIVAATNATFALDARGAIVARYDKAHLVPYGEYLPMPWLLRPLGLARLVPGDLDFRPGPGPRSIVLPPFGAIGFQTCYEIIFSGRVVDPARRPALIFNPSNDAWFGRWGPPQHLAQARMRAIEEGVPIVRATPTGISAVIAADGALLATIPHERAGAAEIALPRPLPPGLFARHGNAIAGALALLLALAAIALRRRAR